MTCLARRTEAARAESRHTSGAPVGSLASPTRALLRAGFSGTAGTYTRSVAARPPGRGDGERIGERHAGLPEMNGAASNVEGMGHCRSSTEEADLGIERVRNASAREQQQAMSGRSLAQRWAAAAAEQAVKEEKLDMPGMQDARARIGKAAVENSAENKARPRRLRGKKKQACCKKLRRCARCS